LEAGNARDESAHDLRFFWNSIGRVATTGTSVQSLPPLIPFKKILAGLRSRKFTQGKKP
jgi:hypothetical protein